MSQTPPATSLASGPRGESACRVQFIADYNLSNQVGGPNQVRRHLCDDGSFAVDHVYINRDEFPNLLSRPEAYNSALLRRLMRTRFRPYFQYFLHTTVQPGILRRILKRSESFRPHFLCSAAYGVGQFYAAELAARTGLPLVMFYHDWWPDLFKDLNPFTLRRMDLRFREVYRRCTLPLCVGDGLAAELGDHPRRAILPPISAAPLSQAPAPSRLPGNNEVLRLRYVGNLSGAHGQNLEALAEALRTRIQSKVELKMFGPTDWPAEKRQAFEASGLYGGIIDTNQAAYELAASDVSLVSMSLNPEESRITRTSFPSKIVDAVNAGKPIFCLAPSYSSASEYVRKHDLGPTLTELNSGQLDAALKQLRQPECYARYAANARKLAEAELAPAKLQQRFMTLVAPFFPQPR